MEPQLEPTTLEEANSWEEPAQSPHLHSQVLFSRFAFNLLL